MRYITTYILIRVALLIFIWERMTIFDIGLLPIAVVLKGNEADPRMRAAAKRRGIQITSMSRPIRPTDFRDFDLILAMDKQNKGRRISIIYNVFMGLL